MNSFRPTLAVVLSVVALSGCATSSDNIYGCCVGQSVVGNQNYVTVSNVWNEMDALPLAEKHCSGHGKSAAFKNMLEMRAVFDCVAQGPIHSNPTSQTRS